MKFAMRFVVGLMFVTVWAVPASAQGFGIGGGTKSQPVINARDFPNGIVPYNGGGFGGLSDRELQRAMARSMGMMGGGVGSMSPELSVPAAPAPPPEKEPNISDEKKGEIYNRYLQLGREYQEKADKLPGSRKDLYLKINRRRVQLDLGQKYALTQQEMQWIMNHGAEIESTNAGVQGSSRDKKPTSDEEKKQLAMDETRKAIFKDWSARRRARLGDAAKISKESKAQAYMKFEDKRLVKELTAKYHITPAELDQIKVLGATKNW
jgi:hypothetical protein